MASQASVKNLIMKFIFYLLMITFCANGFAQRKKQVSIAFMNAATAKPFSHFGNLFSGLHPGVMLGYGYDISSKPRHDWYQDLNIGYFYHRFVQHAITLTTDIGYRYRFSNSWSAQASAGGGYLHSIPATAQLSLNSNGDYKNAKGIGRMQALAAFNIGAGKILEPAALRPIKIFISYRVMLQFPFIKAYVPLLPYNNLLIGMTMPIIKRSK
jgi:hypothetical protein